MSFEIVLLSALIPLIVGSIWYNPKIFGNAWMASIGFTEDDLKKPHRPMWLTFLLLYLFSVIASLVLMQLCIHQIGAFGMIGGELTAATKPSFQAFMTDYGNEFRTFKHGALHGGMASFILSLFMIGTGAMFERKSWIYIFIHVGYFTLCGLLMGGILCQFMRFG